MRNFLTRLIAAATLVSGVLTSHGAEIVLRASARPAGAVVRLEDIADIYTDDAAARRQLLDVELFPTPPAGSKRFVRAREALDALQARGVNLAAHRVAGPNAVEIFGPALPTAESAPLSASQERQAAEIVRSAILRHLAQQNSGEQGWKLDLTLSSNLARSVLAQPTGWQALGGAAPWAGTQRFQLSRAGQTESLTVEANLALPPALVVAVRSIAKNTVVQPGDVELQRGTVVPRAGSEPLTKLEDVVGHETTRSIAVGQLIEDDHIRQPVTVRRGDVVTVYARSAGLRVRTTARAKEDGSLGDLIAVESLLNKDAFFVRVSGIQEAEVFAQGIDASGRQLQPSAPRGSTTREVAEPRAASQSPVGVAATSNVPARLNDNGGSR